jgi:hypothetical protein
MKWWMYASYIYAFTMAAIFVVLTIIVTIGGVFDLRYMFRSLRQEELDPTDDGRVE